MPAAAEILISTIFLNWNRGDLLCRAVESYVRTISVSHEVVIVDNSSTDGSQEFISGFCQDRPNFRCSLLPANEGGTALNAGTDTLRGQFLHFSENDFEYLPGWDKKMMAQFEAFPKLGQLSVVSPFRQPGEMGDDAPARAMKQGERTIYVTDFNVLTTSMIRREIWDKGLRWKNYDCRIKFPHDGEFSADVRRAGYDVAWNDEPVAINWGHKIEDIIRRLPYYLEDFDAKTWLGIDGFRQRLEQHGYTLIKQNDSYQLAKFSEPPAWLPKPLHRCTRRFWRTASVEAVGN